MPQDKRLKEITEAHQIFYDETGIEISLSIDKALRKILSSLGEEGKYCECKEPRRELVAESPKERIYTDNCQECFKPIKPLHPKPFILPCSICGKEVCACQAQYKPKQEYPTKKEQKRIYKLNQELKYCLCKNPTTGINVKECNYCGKPLHPKPKLHYCVEMKRDCDAVACSEIKMYCPYNKPKPKEIEKLKIKGKLFQEDIFIVEKLNEIIDRVNDRSEG